MGALNLFRISADACHLLGCGALLAGVLRMRTIRTMSVRSMELYLLVYVTRYLDMLTMPEVFFKYFGVHSVTTYNTGRSAGGFHLGRERWAIASPGLVGGVHRVWPAPPHGASRLFWSLMVLAFWMDAMWWSCEQWARSSSPRCRC